MNKVIVTTSWDDGHPLDIKLANLLTKYKIKGTFYIAPKNREREQLNSKEIKSIMNLGMEIGAHTMTHPDLTKIPPREALREIKTGKKFLEDLIECKVTSFCYPKGEYNKALKELIKKSGFKLGRTTDAFATSVRFDPFFLPVSMQFTPYKTGLKLGVHALKYGNLRSFMEWLIKYGREANPAKLAKTIFESVLNGGGVFHIWGHSWEIEKHGLWEELEKTLKFISGRGNVFYITNSQLLQYR